MAGTRAPKQWSLSKVETITSFEAWRQNLQYTLSLDQNFAAFLVDGFTWLKKTNANPLRGIVDDGEAVAEANRRTAAQNLLVDTFLTLIASFWNQTRTYFSDWLVLLKTICTVPVAIFITTEKYLKPTKNYRLLWENLIVLTWLRLINRDLPNLVKQRYGTELRSKTLASLKPEISQALDSLLDEIHSATDAKVLRASIKDKHFDRSAKKTGSIRTGRQIKCCILCKQAGRPSQHFLSTCKYLPDEDKQYMSRVRQSYCTEVGDSESEDNVDNEQVSFLNDNVGPSKLRVVSALRRVSTKQSPYFKAFYKHFPLELTLDTGAEVSMIKASSADYIGVTIKKSNHSALQADGVTPLNIVGECHFTLSRDGIELQLEALVVNDLDVDILAGIPFMSSNDIAIFPSKHKIVIRDKVTVMYGSPNEELNSSNTRVRRTQAFLIRAPSASSVVWPGCYGEYDIPSEIESDCILAVEPHTLTLLFIQRNEHFCRVRLTTTIDNAPEAPDNIRDIKTTNYIDSTHTSQFFKQVSVDPDNLLSPDLQTQFNELLRKFSEVFSPNFEGYNGEIGPFEASVNMGPVQPPQRKGVFRKPEDVGISVEYINPSFLVKKASGGFRLVTAFADVGRYSKPQPSLMPDVDSTLRTIAQWKYIIKSDLTSAFYQIPLAKDSMKYCGVATPYRGVRVYTRCAMGMPGSETALEELMCRIVGDFLQKGCVAKLADDLFCGGNTPEELLYNWECVLQSLQKSGICLSPSKTVICPKSITILGWIWSQGSISASTHRVATLASCPVPDTVRGLRSFIGAYKMLSRVIPNCSNLIAPLEEKISGMKSADKIIWSDMLREHFEFAQKSLSSRKAITLPKCSDQLWIVTDGSVTKRGIGATLYINRDGKVSLAGFFSAKLRKHQVLWLPCEIEALSIAASVKHFSPFIIQSKLQANVLTDSKPCVQGFEKLCRGEFSASPRVTSFLSVVSRYQVSVNHLSGRANIPSDFASRNAPVCTEPNCQVCCFISRTEDSVVRAVSIQDVLNDEFRLPFTTRSAWINIQSECPDLRRTHAHLKQGTRPSKKLTNIKDVKRYLNVASIAKDGLLVVRRCDPLAPPNELIIVPRNVLDGLVTALHIKLDHPSKHQLNLVLKRHFYALDMPKAAEQASDSCHTCASLKRFPKSLVEQSSEDPPDLVGISYVADVLKRNRQLILVVRETVTSYTSTCFIKDEKLGSLRDGLIHLLIPLKPLNGPSVVVRVDPAPGFRPLCDDSYLKQLNISIEIGRVKNRNKNPVADKAIAELEDELLREEHDHSPLSENTLVIATTRLNSRLRQRGLSSRELWTQRSQFTHEQLPISDMNLIRAQHEARNKNHGFSENSKCSRPGRPTPDINIGDLVYLYTDRSKTQSRDRYLVVARDGEWCFIKKFSGNQLRASSYKVKLSECYKVLNTISAQQNPRYSQNVYNQESDSDGHDEDSLPGPIRDLPPDRAEPPPILICENIDDVENLDEPTAQHDNSLEHDLTLSNSSTEQDNKRVLRKRSELKTPARFKDFISF
ncbi:unnamed protein product [Mytilus edulis]|uniref:Reverse transcriptase domain-containing protein n=1 Tax=Mytilus edulis TaxID=6550 RepID=A0A8S3TWX5_MYTED|nr:unnamed protein product [Mytilus edulis]